MLTRRGPGGGVPLAADYLVVTGDGVGRDLPYSFLARVQGQFDASYRQAGHTAAPGSLTREFGPVLQREMQAATRAKDGGKASQVAAQVAEVKSVMIDNIEKVLDRGERIETLVDKTETLQHASKDFARSGKKLRNHLWWQNLKMKLIIAFVALSAILVIFLLACYSGGKNCTKKKEKPEGEAAEQAARLLLHLAHNNFNF